MIGSLHEAARALGGEVVGAQIVAPGPGHSPRDRSLRVAISASAPQGFIAHSFAGDDWQTCRDYVASRLGLDHDGWKRDRPEPEPKVKAPVDRSADQQAARNLANAARIIRELRPIATSPDAMRYFEETRRINTKAIADVLSDADAIGWHPECFFREDGHQLDGRRLSCIVAVMTDPSTAKSTGAISRTYIHGGRKIAKAKTLGSPLGVVRLTPDEDVTTGLFIAEGLETALAGMAVGLRPMWSTGSTSIMSTLPVLAEIESLTVVADHDANGAGENAARAVEQTWLAAGREVRVLMPEAPGDLNDARPA
jgi:putative DNA primase/helicase